MPLDNLQHYPIPAALGALLAQADAVAQHGARRPGSACHHHAIRPGLRHHRPDREVREWRQAERPYRQLERTEPRALFGVARPRRMIWL